MATPKLIQYKGQTHDGPDGGIPVDSYGNPAAVTNNSVAAQVEQPEVGYKKPDGSTYVFSDKLKMPGTSKSFADIANNIKSKYKLRLGKNQERFNAIDSAAMQKQLDELALIQETVKGNTTLVNDYQGNTANQAMQQPSQEDIAATQMQGAMPEQYDLGGWFKDHKAGILGGLATLGGVAAMFVPGGQLIAPTLISGGLGGITADVQGSTNRAITEEQAKNQEIQNRMSMIDKRIQTQAAPVYNPIMALGGDLAEFDTEEDAIKHGYIPWGKTGIYIKPSRRGTFTAAAKRAGMGVQAFARHVLANKDRYSSAMVKKANFARNAAKWKHELGGPIQASGIMQHLADGGKIATVGGKEEPGKLPKYTDLVKLYGPNLERMPENEKEEYVRMLGSIVGTQDSDTHMSLPIREGTTNVLFTEQRATQPYTQAPTAGLDLIGIDPNTGKAITTARQAPVATQEYANALYEMVTAGILPIEYIASPEKRYAVDKYLARNNMNVDEAGNVTYGPDDKGTYTNTLRYVMSFPQNLATLRKYVEATGEGYDLLRDLESRTRAADEANKARNYIETDRILNNYPIPFYSKGGKIPKLEPEDASTSSTIPTDIAHAWTNPWPTIAASALNFGLALASPSVRGAGRIPYRRYAPAEVNLGNLKRDIISSGNDAARAAQLSYAGLDPALQTAATIAANEAARRATISGLTQAATQEGIFNAQARNAAAQFNTQLAAQTDLYNEMLKKQALEQKYGLYSKAAQPWMQRAQDLALMENDIIAANMRAPDYYMAEQDAGNGPLYRMFHRPVYYRKYKGN